MPCQECIKKRTARVENQLHKHSPCPSCQKSATQYPAHQRESRRIPFNVQYHQALPSILKKHDMSLTLCSRDSRNVLHIKSLGDDLETVIYPFELCVLPDVAFVDGKARFIPIQSYTDRFDIWNADFTQGAIADLETQTVITGLCLPQSPCYHDGELWFLNSGKGKLCKATAQGVIDIASIPAMASGLAFAGNLAFIGLSPVRNDDDTARLPIAQVITEAERNYQIAQDNLRVVADNPDMTEDEYSKALETHDLARATYNDLFDSSGKCGLWVVDTARGEAMAYYYVDSIAGVDDVRILPSDAIITVGT